MDSKERDKAVEIATDKPDVPFVAYERAEAAYERHIMRYWVLCLVLLGLLVASNVGWLVFISGYDFESYSAEVDAGETGSVNYNYIGDSIEGDINNGSSDSKKNFNEKAEQFTGENDQNDSEGAQ